MHEGGGGDGNTWQHSTKLCTVLEQELQLGDPETTTKVQQDQAGMKQIHRIRDEHLPGRKFFTSTQSLSQCLSGVTDQSLPELRHETHCHEVSDRDKIN